MLSPRFLVSVWLIACLNVIQGCGFVTVLRATFNETLTKEDVAFIVPGETRFQDVVARLGVPDELDQLAEGGVGIYHFRDVKFSRTNFGWLTRFWLPVSPDLILAGGGLGTDQFYVVFDEQWIVRHSSFGRHVGPLGFVPKPL